VTATVVNVKVADVPVPAVVACTGTDANMRCACGNGGAARKLQLHVDVVAVHVDAKVEPMIVYVEPVIWHREPPHEHAQFALAPVRQLPHDAKPLYVEHTARPVSAFVL
jgi:hypothetical protein